MKHSHENRQRRTKWERLIAFALALSMVLIPVNFPRAVSAAEETNDILPNIITDNFSDSRYVDGVTYKWENVGTAIWSVKDGYYESSYVPTSGTYRSQAYLRALDSNGKDLSKAWSDYTFSVSYMRTAVTAENGIIGGQTVRIWVRGQEGSATGYVIQMSGGDAAKDPSVNVGVLSLNKVYLDDEGTETNVELARAANQSCVAGAWNNIKIDLNGNDITVSYNDKAVISYTDDGTKGGAAYTAGSVYLETQGRGGITNFDDAKVIFADGSSVFYDDFSDNRFVQGTTYQFVGDTEREAWDLDVNWEPALNGGTTLDISAAGEAYTEKYGTSLNVTTGTETRQCVYLNTSTVNPDDPTEIIDPSASWMDYTVEADIRRNTSTSTGAFLLGRVHTDEAGKICYYGLKVHSQHVYLVKVFTSSINGGTVEASKTLISQWNAGEGNWAHFSITFRGNEITATMTKENGQTKSGTYVDEGEMAYTYTSGTNQGRSVKTRPFLSGGVGIRTDKVTGGWVANFDNFKVTLADGTVAYEDSFTLAENQTADAYLAATRTTEKAHVVNSWAVKDGVYNAICKDPSVSLISAKSGETNLAENWSDYAIDTDVALGDANSAVSIIAHASGDSYYELRMTSTALSLYQVSGSNETLLDTQEKAFTPGNWYFTKLEVDGDGSMLKAYVDASLILEVPIASGALTKGAMGYKVTGTAKFDNLSVYAVELSDNRQFATYTFAVPSIDALASDWEIGTDGIWKIVDDKLVYENSNASKVGISALKKKCTLDNYNAEVSVITPAAGEVGVMGRYDVNTGSYYKLVLDQEDGLVLSKVVNDGEPAVLDSVSFKDLYLAGVKVKSNMGYILRLYMHDGLIQGYLNGVRMVEYKDDAPIEAGVTGVVANNGGAIVSLTTSEAFAPAQLTLVDDKGNAVGTAAAPIEVPLGHVPNLIYLFIKADDGVNEVKMIPVDTLNVTMPENGLALGEHMAEIGYDDRIVPLYYKIVDRTEDVNALSAAIEALDLANLDEAQVNALAQQYDGLTYVEKAKLTDAVKEKLAKAEETILFQKYPEIAGTKVVFSDDFDTVDANDKYENDYDITYMSDMGNWFVLNGEMYEYDTHTVNSPQSYNTANKLMNRDFSVRSISVDFQLIEEKAWAGFQFHLYGKEAYELRVTDKENRIYLFANSGVTIYANKEDGYKDEHKDLDFETGKWYNLRVTYDEGYVRCYVDGVLWIEHQAEKNSTFTSILDHGAVSLRASENWVKFDNFEVRGVENEWVDEDGYTTNPNLPATEWTDDFQDETAGKDPSHWQEPWPQDKWTVKAEGDNLYYSSTDHTADTSFSWLHVFETDVDVSAKLRVTAVGDFPVVGLVTRLNTRDSYIKAGYDFTMDKWFIKVRYGRDFAEVTTWADAESVFDLNKWYTVRLVAEDTKLELYADGEKVVTADAGKKVMPGNIGVYTECCNIDMDDFDAKLLSGQGSVIDGAIDYYSEDVIAGYSGDLFSIMELGDGRLLAFSGSSYHYVSADGGKTWERTKEFSNNGFQGGAILLLHDDSWLNIKNFTDVSKSTDGGLTWTKIGALGEAKVEGAKYSMECEYISEIEIAPGKWRIFYCIGDQNAKNDRVHGTESAATNIHVLYSDDGGVTWSRSENTPFDISNMSFWCESTVIQIEKDVVDATGKTIPAGTLIHYSAMTIGDCMRYSLSYDGGVTWEGDYAMPQLPAGYVSKSIEEDHYNPGTYYMATLYNPSRTSRLGQRNGIFDRLRVVLLKSTDGYNWDFVCDIDRWGDVSDTDMANLMQNQNMYISVSEDYIYIQFSRSEAYSTDSHNEGFGVVHILEKDKLPKVDGKGLPAEYVIPDKAIVAIEGVAADEYIVNSEFACQVKVYYYDGTTALVDMDDVYVTEPDMSVLGEQKVIVDYKSFRDIFTINVVMGDAPALSVEDGKTYCGEQEVTVTNANGDLVSVTLNGTAVTLTDGKFTVTAKEGQQTIVATDKVGNVTTVKITVNAGHTGGTATCEDKAVCTVCGEAYGELNADNHTGEAKWIKTADKHSKVYDCCGEVVIEEAAHTGGTATCEDKAVCTVCGEAYGELNADNHTGEAKWIKTADKHSKAYECCGEVVIEEAAHTGGTATCEDKTVCTVCGEAYGELNADNHTGEAKWSKTETKHIKAYDCCGKVVVAEEAHKLTDGKCECGYEAPAPVEPGEIENTTDADKNACGGTLDVKDEHLSDKLLTEEEKEAVKGGADIEISLKIEDISDKVSAADKAAVENKLGDMKIGMYLDIDLEKKVGDKAPVKITKTNGGVTVTITVPAELINTDAKIIRTYKVIRVHEGVADVLDATFDAKTGKLSFETDKFSTYTLVYSDAPSSDNSNTGDNTMIVLFGSLLALSVVATGVLLIPDVRKKLFK